MKPCPYPIAALLPHKAPMILLDHVIGMGPQSVEAAVRVTAGRLFFEEGRGVPAHVAWNGWRKPAGRGPARRHCKPAPRSSSAFCLAPEVFAPYARGWRKDACYGPGEPELHG